jgi:hypothetical protein
VRDAQLADPETEGREVAHEMIAELVGSPALRDHAIARLGATSRRQVDLDRESVRGGALEQVLHDLHAELAGRE